MRYLNLLPFAYTVTTRARTLRDLAHLTVTQILPGVWIVYQITDSILLESVISYLVGYLSFISIYELGYLGNDLWDAKRGGNGRRRVTFQPSISWILLFASIRLLLWAAILFLVPPATQDIWIAGFGALAFVFLMHNVIISPMVRVATFTQLCLLRYLLPIVYATGTDRILEVVTICVLFYFGLRYLSYLDNKSWLNLPGRRNPKSGICFLASLLPVTLIFGLFTPDRLPWEIYFFSLAVQLSFLSMPVITKLVSRQ